MVWVIIPIVMLFYGLTYLCAFLKASKRVTLNQGWTPEDLRMVSVLFYYETILRHGNQQVPVRLPRCRERVDWKKEGF
jgi:hypothetical protein